MRAKMELLNAYHEKLEFCLKEGRPALYMELKIASKLQQQENSMSQSKIQSTSKLEITDTPI